MDNYGIPFGNDFKSIRFADPCIVNSQLSIAKKEPSNKDFSDRQRGILAQIKVGSPQTYFVYFKGFQQQSCGKRTGVLLKSIFDWRPKVKRAAATNAAALPSLQ